MNDDIDQLLTGAGQRWQATQPPPPEPDQTRWAAAGQTAWRPRASRYLAIGVAAAAVAATIAGSMAVWPRAAAAPDDVAVSPAPDPAALVVRDGDLVEATGEVEADPGRPVRLCPSAFRTLPSPLPPCPYAITAEGVDFDRVADRREGHAGRVSGWVRLRGVYRDGTVTVTQQWAQRPARELPLAPPASCRPPEGGWRPDNGANTTQLAEFVDRHPERFSAVQVAHPDPADSSVAVMVVGVVGEDPATVTKELARYQNEKNLCVVRAEYSRTRLDQVNAAVLAVDDATRNTSRANIFSTAVGAYFPAADRVRVGLVQLDPDTYAEFQKIGLELLLLEPFLRPAR